MDGSGGNRYELLYMDDDASDPLENLVRKKAKQQKQKNAGGNNSGNETKSTNLQQQQQQHGNNKKSMNIGFGAEKENKSSALNKNIDKKTGGGVQVPAAATAAQGGPSGGQKQKGTTNSTQGGQFKDQSNYRNSQDQRQQRDGKNFDRNVNFKQQNGETREQRNNRRNRDERPQQNGTIAPGEYQQNNERPQRRGGPPRRNNNFEQGGGRGGKREFDRQSGSDKTGVKAVDKRDGAGAHNWGSAKQDIEDITKSHDDGVLTDKDESAGDQQIEQQTANIEEETKELTLDEWKAQRAVRAKPQFNIRKAGEGEDLSQWKKMVALNNKKRDEESEEELEYDPSMYPQRVGRLQRVLDIEFHFNDGRRVGGIGRGRGRARGQGGQGGGGGGGAGGGGGGGAGGRQGRVPRNAEGKILKEGGGERQPRGERGGGGGGGQGGPGGPGGQHAPKVDDEHDFPSLG